MALVRRPSPGLARCLLTHIPRQAIDVELAARQHRAYCQTLERSGLQVTYLPPLPDHPDAVFVEDTAVVLDELAIIARPAAASRRPECASALAALQAFRPVARIAAPATLDGGDILIAGKQVFAGRSSRTNPAAIQALAALVVPHGYRVTPVPVRGCLHLKSACTLLDPETVLLNPSRVDPSLFSAFRRLETPPAEPEAANVLRTGDTLIMHRGFPKTAGLLARFGCRLQMVDISEFLKAEAGATCLSIIFPVSP